MMNCDFQSEMEVIVLYLVLSQFRSLDTATTEDCPPGQVLHYNLENNKGLCCIPVLLQRGYEAVPCSEDGTEDGVQKCQNGTHQPDETSSRHMPQCIVDPQCTDEGIRKDFKCIDEYCWPVCICSLEHGKCGLDPFDCTDIKKITCLSKILLNCSCAPTYTTSTLATSSFNTVKPIGPEFTTESSLPTLTNESWTGSTKIVDRDNTTEDGSDKVNTWIIPVFIIGCAFLGLVVIVVVALCIYCKRKKANMQNGVSQDASQGEPAGIEMEAQSTLPEDSVVNGKVEPAEHEEEIQPFLSWGSGQDESFGHEVDAQPFSSDDSEESGQSEPAGHEEAQAILSGDLPQDYSGEQTSSFEVPNLSLSGNWSTFSSSLFQSHDNATNQQEVSDESERHQTHVKGVFNRANLNEEEEHHSGGEDKLNVNLSINCSTSPNSSFENQDNTTDHHEVSDESERHQTNVKVIFKSENLSEEVRNHSSAVDTLSDSRLYHEGVEPWTLSSNGLWCDFNSSILHGTECDDIPQAGSDIPQAGSDIPQAGSRISQAGSDIQQARSDIQQAGSDISQAESISQRELEEEDDD